MFNSEGHLTLSDKFLTLQLLLKFTIKINSNDIKNLLKFIDLHINLAIGENSLENEESSKKLAEFIIISLEIFEKKSNSQIYTLDILPSLIKRLLKEDRLFVSKKICLTLIHSNTIIKSKEQLLFVLSLVSSLVRECDGDPYFYSIFHLINAGSLEKTMLLIQELANSMNVSTPKAAANAILPIGFVTLKLIPSTINHKIQQNFKKTENNNEEDINEKDINEKDINEEDINEDINEDHNNEEEDEDQILLLKKLILFLMQYIKTTTELSPKNTLLLALEVSKVLDKLKI